MYSTKYVYLFNSAFTEFYDGRFWQCIFNQTFNKEVNAIVYFALPPRMTSMLLFRMTFLLIAFSTATMSYLSLFPFLCSQKKP